MDGVPIKEWLLIALIGYIYGLSQKLFFKSD